MLTVLTARLVALLVGGSFAVGMAFGRDLARLLLNFAIAWQVQNEVLDLVFIEDPVRLSAGDGVGGVVLCRFEGQGARRGRLIGLKGRRPVIPRLMR